ncbi:sulfur carrier protein ThiS [Salinimonas sp. HHU 13199]|uniref:Sulfur carrier protein ThiS n=1 Tax=Salinimonas profundi TaxID=2729140 RepID=A0ABR8LQY3_9ALTE|nr:sulfur carrier protein ThiS [Salinimonas profundi]MBD3587466.1 sulfur carrier protein ThiS [Salinimonas profundi]
MNITINDTPYTLTEPTSLDAIPQIISLPKDALALAVNQCIVHRENWAKTVLQDGDHIDAFTVVAGG